jgi:hypothetical protein
MNHFQQLFHNRFFIRLFNWEYWPFAAVYSPVLLFWLVLSARARSFFFFNASNPSIENGGLLNESKKDIHNILPDHLYPRTLHFSNSDHVAKIIAAMQSAELTFPVFAKPDIGGKGRGVKKIHTVDELAEYVRNATMPFHIQELVPFENEVGIFYFKYPGNEKGEISGIVRKEFLSVTGNGKESFYELLKKDKRGIMYVEQIKELMGNSIFEIPSSNEKVIVSPYGNHARGSLFIDDTHLSDERLLRIMDNVAAQIPGFYFGRLDIRFSNWDSFKNGRDFKVIELNGAGAEPTHIYDPKHSIFFAWREIVKHWWVMTTISIMNRKMGIPYLSFKQGIAMLKQNSLLSKKLAEIPR